MKHYQNTLTGEVVSEDEYSYAAAQKGNWVLYPKIPRYTIETPPYAAGRTEFDEDGKLCYWDDVKDIVRELEELKSAVVASLILLPKDNDGKRLLEDALRFGAPEIYGMNNMNMKTQKYIIRCEKAGVFYGEIAERRGSEVDLLNVRRIHGWDGACSLSQLAMEGCKRTGGNNRHSMIVPSMTVLGVIELIPVSDDAMKNLDGQPIWKI